MASKIGRSPRAASNLEDICNYISRDSEHYASLFAKRIFDVIQNLSYFPRSGRIIPEYGDEKIREVIHQNHRIVYRVRGDTVEIVAICHGAKPLEDIPLRKRPR